MKITMMQSIKAMNKTPKFEAIAPPKSSEEKVRIGRENRKRCWEAVSKGETCSRKIAEYIGVHKSTALIMLKELQEAGRVELMIKMGSPTTVLAVR
jgi:hypothetical protein